MKVSCKFKKNKLVFSSKREETDKPMDHLCGNHDCYVELPFDKMDNIHPDHIGLATILLFNPFIGSELSLPCEVSKEFFDAVSRVLSKYKIVSNYSEKIEPFNSSENSRPSLALSGGQDSVAALSLMPENTICAFLDRPISRNSLYNPDAAYKTCESLNQIGYEVVRIKSDLEYLRNPVGFPSDLSNGVPLILMAKYLDIDSIAFGTVLESSYGIGHEEYRDYPRKPHHKFYGSIFKAAGVEKNFPVGGISEIGTSIINNKSSIGKFSQSCIRGSWKNPCHRCWKCFRKDLLSLALDPSNDDFKLELAMIEKEVQTKLSQIPISHENVILYSIKKIDIKKYDYLYNLKLRVDRDLNLNFLERWYHPSLALIPDKYSEHIRDRILDFLPGMNIEQCKQVEEWDMNEFILEKDTVLGRERLLKSWKKETNWTS